MSFGDVLWSGVTQQSNNQPSTRCNLVYLVWHNFQQNEYSLVLKKEFHITNIIYCISQITIDILLDFRFAILKNINTCSHSLP